MLRRDFIFKTMLASAGGLLLPTFLSSCSKDVLDELDKVTFNGKVLIVGAGAAGLYAAMLLKERGVTVQILEASNRYGGRMGKTTQFADYPIDLGAQWLHGNKSKAADMVQQASMTITRDNADFTYWFNQQIESQLPKNPFFLENGGLPDASFWDVAQQRGFGNDYRYIVEAIAGDLGADATDVSAYWNYKEFENWNSGDNDYKFEQTYFDLIDSQIAALVTDDILLNTEVTEINYTNSGVVVKTANNEVFEADKIIVTVPISILKAGTISFNPPLSVAKTDAFQKIGMGPGMKVFLRFSQRFYPEMLIGGATCAAYVDDTLGKQTQEHVLLAFIMGHQAAQLSALGSDAAITAELLAELDLMFAGKATANFIDSMVIDWGQMPHIQGAYSYSTVGMGNARTIAAQPVERLLYFAGEAMNIYGHHQTVHGAMESAEKQVRQLLLDTL